MTIENNNYSTIFNKSFNIQKQIINFIAIISIIISILIVLTYSNNSIISLLSTILLVIGELFFVILVVKVIDLTYNNKPYNIKTLFEESKQLILPLFSTSILMAFFLFLLFILLFIPGIIFTIFWTFTIFFVILENKKGKEALDASKELVKNKWLKTFGYLLLTGLILSLINTPIMFILNKILLGTGIVSFLLGILAYCVLLIINIFSTIFMYVLYKSYK